MHVCCAIDDRNEALQLLVRRKIPESAINENSIRRTLTTLLVLDECLHRGCKALQRRYGNLIPKALS